MQINLEKIVRPNIWTLQPYSSARDEFTGEASVYLDANENPYNAQRNRYPDPLQRKLKAAIAQVKGVSTESIFLGVGSDEPIDLAYRVFCEPKVDNVVAIDPTYGMYKVAAGINNVEYRATPLNEHFQFTADRLLQAADKHTKLIFLCSPNNPTGNLLDGDEIKKVITTFDGIVIVDEAYIDFAERPSLVRELDKYPNLIVLQTFSKAWASASVRLGMAFASPEIITVFNKVKYPYNINQLTQEYGLQVIAERQKVAEWVKVILAERAKLAEALTRLPCVERLYLSDANFILTKVSDANAIYRYLVKSGVIVRNRTNIALCANCLRITVGTPDENRQLIEALNSKRLHDALYL